MLPLKKQRMMILTHEIIIDNTLLRGIYDFVSRNLNFDSNENEVELEAKNYIDGVVFSDALTKENFVQNLNDISFYDISIFNTQKVNENLFDEMNLLDRFKVALIKLLSETGVAFRTYISKPLQRKISPSLSAYDYVGNNELDIVQSNRSYGLLFE